MPDLSQAPTAPFVWGAGGAQMTPERIEAERKLAQAMMAKGMDYSPVQSWSQGASRVAQAMLGAFDDRRASQAETANATADKEWIKGLMPGATAPAAPAAPAAAAPVAATPPTVLGAGGTPAVADPQGVYGADAVMMPQGGAPAKPDYGSAIASIESAGQANPYAAVGPATRTGDRAYGKYQVMGANIPAWTKEHLGKEMMPQEFMANPQAQDAVFNGQFGKYVQQTGNPQDAASMWFTGKPQAQGAGLSDVNGTTGQSYVQRFTKALGPAGAPAPAVAGADPAALPPNATPTQGTIPPGVTTPAAPGVPAVAGAMGGVNPALLAKITDPYASEGVKKIATLLLQHQMQGDAVTHVDLGGQIGIMDKRGNIIRTVQKTEPTKAPTIVEGEVDPATGYPAKLLLRGDGKYERISLPPTPAAPGAPAPAAPAVPPPPPGARAKEWYEMKSKDTAEAAIALPETIAKAQRSLDLIDMIEKHPGRETGTGLSSLIDPRNYIPGTHAKDFQVRQRQLQGQAFLEAFQSLKGGGAITDIEGKKATEAMASLDTSQSDETYVRSLRELREIITNGMNRAKAKADASFKPPAAPSAAAPAPGGAPAAGMVQDGYRFKGGNPAEQANWEKI